MQPDVNTDLQLAFDFVHYTNRNIFLTGKAGTGKTTFLHNIKKISPKRMIVVAPTGVAAINAGGVTIHSFFQLPFHPHVPAQYFPAETSESPSPLASHSFKLSREKVNIIKGLDLLVIDEISMVRADLLDAVDMVLRRYKDRSKPFGGVQLLLIGDIRQLAPVVKEEDREIIERYYDTAFFFSSHSLRSTDYVTIELKHIYRQQDQEFIGLLNKIRDNQLDQATQAMLNKRYDPHFNADSGGGYITLTTHNAQAQTINDSRLEKLPGKVHRFKAIVRDEFPEYAYPTASELELKTGAQVMFVKNDISKEKVFFNGKIGKITGFEEDLIIVQCPGDDAPIPVEMAEWQNMKYTLDEETKEIQETVIGTFTQYPLKLAWAITIHKSQGLTFDKAIIDAGAAFAHGQVYVALSRCRTLDGLVLSTPINQRGIISDPAVSGFSHEAEQNQPDNKVLMDSRKAYQWMLIEELFDFNPLLHLLYYLLKLLNEHHESLLGSPLATAETAIINIKNDLTAVSERFHRELKRLLEPEPDVDSNSLLQERMRKACEYFAGKLQSGIIGPVKSITVETDNKVIRKSVSDALSRVKQESAIKLACLDQMKSGFGMKEYLQVKAKASLNIPETKAPAKRSIEDASGEKGQPDLYNLLKKWRDHKARESNLPHYMILPLSTMSSLAGYMPKTISELKMVKGMGKKKSEKYGDELLSIITGYLREKAIAIK